MSEENAKKNEPSPATSSVLQVEYLVYDDVTEQVLNTHFNMVVTLSIEDIKKMPVRRFLEQLPVKKVQDRIIAQPVFAIREAPVSDPTSIIVLCGAMTEDEEPEKLKHSAVARLTQFQDSALRVMFKTKITFKNQSLPLEIHKNIQSTVKLMNNCLGNCINYWYYDGICLTVTSNQANPMVSTLWYTYLLYRLSLILTDCKFTTSYFENATQLELKAPHTTWFDVLLERAEAFAKEEQEAEKEIKEKLAKDGQEAPENDKTPGAVEEKQDATKEESVTTET